MGRMEWGKGIGMGRTEGAEKRENGMDTYDGRKRIKNGKPGMEWNQTQGYGMRRIYWYGRQ